MTFYGESMGVRYDTVLSGSLSEGDVATGVTSINDGSTVTMTAGDSVIVVLYGRSYLTSTDVIGAVNWVIRASGTAALDLADAHDAVHDFSAPFTALSSIAVSGGSLTDHLFAASPDLKNAPLLCDSGDGEVIELKITVTSGTVTLDKVRLQIEPPGGVGGGLGAAHIPPPTALTARTVSLCDGETLDNWMSPGSPVVPYYQEIIGITVPVTNARILWHTCMVLDGHPEFVTIRERNGILSMLPDNYLTYRDEVPPGIEGVDWIGRPDRTPNDFDRALTYDSGPNVLLGWSPTYSTTYADSAPWPERDEFVIFMVYGAPDQAIGDTPVWPVPADGTVLRDYLVSSGPDLNTLPDPGPVSSIGLFVRSSRYSALPDTYDSFMYSTDETHPFIECDGGTTSYLDDDSHAGYRLPEVNVQQPPYHCWVPAQSGPNLDGKFLDDRVRFTGGS